MQFSSWMEQVSKSYFVSADDVLMTTITKFKPQVVFQYGFCSFLQHRNTVKYVSVMGLTRCYKTTVFYIYTEKQSLWNILRNFMLSS